MHHDGVSIRDGLDLSTPAGRMMAGVLASVAQYETEIHGERTSAGQAVARSKGKHMGRAAGIHTAIKVTDELRAPVIRPHSEVVKVSSGANGLAAVDTVTRWWPINYKHHPW